jgi:hypothetical protein
MSTGTYEYVQKSFRVTMLAIIFLFILHNSGPQGYIQLQKTLGHLHNDHILLPRANSSYWCHEFKIQNPTGL